MTPSTRTNEDLEWIARAAGNAHIIYHGMRIYLSALLIVISLNLAFGQEKIDSTIHCLTTAAIDGNKYLAFVKESPLDQAVIITNKTAHKTLKIAGKLLYSDGICDINFIDFNHDGYKDLIIDYLTNTPYVQDLMMYNKIHKTFVKVKNFSSYPDAKPIPGTNLFYSYHKSGCADLDWDSDLFTIRNFKVIKLGNISGQGCGGEDGIYVSLITKQKKILIKKIPISIIEHYKQNKWGFIVDYWKHHYSNFVQP
jgi:hypothetical protein